MFRQHEMIPSEPMGRRMHLWRYGHWGAPLLVLPSAAGFAHEWEAQGMLEVVEDLIQGARLKLYCSESNVAEAWTRKESDAVSRLHRHALFEKYVVEELVPWIRRDCGAPAGQENAEGAMKIGVTGCSLGAFYAANFALKYPEIFDFALCMSGRYDTSHFLDGHRSVEAYLNNPLAYLPRLQGEELERVQKNTFLTLVCGQGAFEEGCIEETIALADVCESKGIPHRRDIWGRDVAHNWAWWKRQARMHLVHAYGN